MVDALAQLLEGAGSGTSGAQLTGWANRIRLLAGQAPDTIIATADAWAYLVYTFFLPDQARPRLLELPLSDASAEVVRGDHAVLHGTMGAWNGHLVVVVSRHQHTEPVWWCNPDGSHGPTVAGASLAVPALVSGVTALSSPTQVALAVGLDVLDQVTAARPSDARMVEWAAANEGLICGAHLPLHLEPLSWLRLGFPGVLEAPAADAAVQVYRPALLLLDGPVPKPRRPG